MGYAEYLFVARFGYIWGSMLTFFRFFGLLLLFELVLGSSVVVAQHLSTAYFVDSTAALTYSQVKDGHGIHFKPGKAFVGEHPTWIRVDVPKGIVGSYCFDYGVTTSTEAYWSVRGETRRTINGSFVPPSQRSEPRHVRTICLELDSSTRYVYMRFPPDDIRLAAEPVWELVPREVLESQLDRSESESFIITGGMIVFALMSLALFLYLRDRTFLLFGFYLVSMYTMVSTNFLGYHLGDMFPLVFLNWYSNQIFFIATPLLFTWFSYEYFLVKLERGVWRSVFQVLFLFSLVCFATFLGSRGLNTFVILIYNFVVVVTVFLYSILRYLKERSSSMLYFLVGLAFPVTAAILIFIHSLAIIHIGPVRQLAGGATLIFCMVMGVGLVDRFRRGRRLQVRREQEAALLTVRSEALEKQNRLIEEQKTALETQARKYSDLNETKDKLLSVLSHDLRGPLGNLGAILDLLSSNALTLQEFQQLSGKLRTDVRSTHTMLEEVLQWVRSQRDGIIPKPVVIDLNLMIEQSLHDAAHQSSPKGIRLEFNRRASLKVYADIDHVSIVLRNLLSNAIKFSPANQVVTVEAYVEEARGVISIRNFGVPIAPTEIEKIVAGQKVVGTRGSSGEKGTGLGLAMCQEFIVANQGQFAIVSSKDEGTVVTVSLPLAP